MHLESDYTRRFLLLSGDIVDCEKELSELRNILLDHKADLPQFLHDEIAELTKTLARIKSEYAEMFKTLEDFTKGEHNGPNQTVIDS